MRSVKMDKKHQKQHLRSQIGNIVANLESKPLFPTNPQQFVTESSVSKWIDLHSLILYNVLDCPLSGVYLYPLSICIISCSVVCGECDIFD